MPYRKEEFINGETYHIILRAIDNNLIFKNVDDYYRGIFSIYEFNNLNPVDIWLRRQQRKKEKLLENPMSQFDSRENFVDVLAFCFMPNHIHLLLKQLKENGISKFMQKVGIGYGKYFNGKYERRGYVFQNRFKSVRIKDDDQFIIVVPYIFTNPTALIEPGWKEQGIRNHSVEETLEFLENYKWSSYQDCIGVKNFPSVIKKDFVLEIMGGESGIKDAVENWIKYKKDMGQYAGLFLE